MATEKQIQMRIVATKNISKITKSMKMVSASKLRGDQERLAAARPFSVSTINLLGRALLYF
jgi:F0F1-type ATP synthase gamma subunit